MNDETFVFHQEIREKKTAARSAHNKRTHTGKRGAVKFPTDYMTKKELAKMSGEVKAYRLNDPMSWAEFKAMPEDIQTSYIKNIRDKFNVPAYKIGEMFGVSAWTMSEVCKRLSIVFRKGRCGEFDAAAWDEWCGKGEKAESDELPMSFLPCDGSGVAYGKPVEVLPCNGIMTFVGTADDALNTLRRVLGDASARITVMWEAVE